MLFYCLPEREASTRTIQRNSSYDRSASHRHSSGTESVERNSGEYESSRGYTTSEDGSLKLERRKKGSRTKKHLIDASKSIQRYIS